MWLTPGEKGACTCFVTTLSRVDDMAYHGDLRAHLPLTLLPILRIFHPLDMTMPKRESGGTNSLEGMKRMYVREEQISVSFKSRQLRCFAVFTGDMASCEDWIGSSRRKYREESGIIC